MFMIFPWACLLIISIIETYFGITTNLIPILIGFSLPLWLLIGSIKIVNQIERVVVFRYGKFYRVYEPGLFILVPLIDVIAERINIQDNSDEVPAEEAITSDMMKVTIKTIVFWKVADVQKASLSVEDYYATLLRTAQVCLRDMIGRHTLNDLLSDRAKADAELAKVIESRVSKWGLEVTSVDIVDITIPDELLDVMSRKAQAEKERDARVTLAEAEVLIAQKNVEAATLYDESPTALKIRQMGLVYEMGKNNATIVVPTEMLGAMSTPAATVLSKMIKK